MKKLDLSRIVFISTCAYLIFVYGLLVGTIQIFPHAIIQKATYSVAQVYMELNTLLRVRPDHFLQPARYDGDGVTVNAVPGAGDGLILISGFFKDTNELRLIRRDGSIVARWPVSFSDIFPDASHLRTPPVTDWNIDTHGALIQPDGSVVFNFEYGGLVKLDRCGAVRWTLPLPTHHSVEPAEAGGYWVPGRRIVSEGTRSPFPPFEPPFYEDTILRISETGQVMAEISVPQILYDNGLGAILTANGERITTGMTWDAEIVHLNKIAELTSDIADDFPLFEAGDLALSIRKLNMVLVIDPDTGEVRWWRIGPWLRQHDPEFKAGGTIAVFNNNIFRTAMDSDGRTSHPSVPRVSNIIEIDPATDRYEILYGGNADQELLTIIRGKHELTPNDGLLITEFEGGRVFETDSNGNIVWEYINRYSAEEVAEITEARIYAKNYFGVTDWSCQAHTD